MSGSTFFVMNRATDVPRPRRTHIERPRVIAALQSAIGSGLIVLQAPPGSGKTAAAAELARSLEGEYTTRWLSLDSSCAVPEVFAERLAHALAGGPVDPISAAGRVGDLKAYLGAATAAAARATEPALFVIDNVQELGKDEATIDLLGWFIETAPDGMEVVLSCRELPPLADFDERIAAGEITVTGCKELTFDDEELSRLIAFANSPLSVAELREASAGWPVGVMAILSGTLSARDSSERRQESAWARYLGSTVWNCIPAHLQPAMLRLSLLETIDARAASRLAGPGAWLTLNRWLSDHDFLYEQLEDDRIRFNPLLRGYLKELFRVSNPAEFDATVADLIARAERDGNLAQAIEFARTTGHGPELAQLLLRHSQRLIHLGAFQLLWRGFEALPAELPAANPVLAAIRARALAHIGRIDEALAITAEQLEGGFTGPARIHATLARMRALRLAGRIDELVTLASSVRVVEDCPDESLVAELDYHEAEIALSAMGDLNRAERLLRQTIARCDPGSHPLGMLALSTLGQLFTIRGDGPNAVNTLSRAAEGWRRGGRSSNLGWVLNNLGMAHVQVGDFESAATVLEEAREEGLRCENQRNVAYATASLGDAHLALGQWQSARERYEEAIRICAEDAPDETLAALSIAGLSGALLGLGDLTESDYFIRRALLVAEVSSNGFELATCKLQEAAVESAAGNHAAAIQSSHEAVALFDEMDARSSATVARYRLALCQFRCGKRGEAQTTLGELVKRLTEPWMFGVLVPLVREHRMFAQWAVSHGLSGEPFRELTRQQTFESDPVRSSGASASASSRPPMVTARSLGRLGVQVDKRAVSDEDWTSARARELFFLLLEHRDGLRKEEAAELLYPELSPARCNSAFHSNLYRLRRALYHGCVVKSDGAYVLNPNGVFRWDVDQFRELISAAETLPIGSSERAEAYERALQVYQGPFADAFFGEWAQSVRFRSEQFANSALAALAGYHASRGDFEAAAGCMERILAADRLNEEAAYELAVFRARAGQPAAAVAFLDGYRRTYEAEAGTPLPGRFAALRERVASGTIA